MDIYILRNGQETGPYSEATAHSLVSNGSIKEEDLAWRSGMPSWSPLAELLHAAAKPAASAFGAEPPAVLPTKKGEPATAKQKAMLSYLGTTFAPEITKEEAAILVNEAMENPQLHVRVAKWNEDRLKLHPELFTEEIQARKENRANRFCEACQVEGANHFSNVTKAHCQVLVSYLDVRFPNWDAQDSEAIWGYFFPAVAEKFPQLVNKGWRGKLKYADGPKVAAELVVPKEIEAPRARVRVPLGPMIRGAVLGLALLLMLYVGMQFSREALPNAQTPVTRPEISAAPVIQDDGPKIRRVNPSDSNPSETAPAPAVADTTPAAENAPMASTSPASDSVSLFDEPTTTTPAPVPAVIAPATPRPKTHLTVTKATEVRLPFGSARLPVGTQLKIVSQAGQVVNALYTNNVVVQLPLSATDLAEP